MAKPELGTKRLCPHCGAKFYDLGKDPIVCPKCGSEVEIVPLPSRGRPDTRPAAASSEEAEPAEAQGVETVSLEEADAETSGKKSPNSPDVDADEDVDDDAEDDSTFLEETDDENDDVSDIIGSDIEDEEES